MFTYNLSETEYLTFNQTSEGIELFSSADGSPEKKKIAVYKTGKWCFESYEQKKLFWFLFSLYKKQFGKGFKAFLRSLKEKPNTYEFSCVRRRFSIKVTKWKKGWDNWFYGLYPKREW